MYMEDIKTLGKTDNEKTEPSGKLLERGEAETSEKNWSEGKLTYRITEAQEEKVKYEYRNLRHFV